MSRYYNAWPCDHRGQAISQWDLSGPDRHDALLGAVLRTTSRFYDARVQDAITTILQAPAAPQRLPRPRRMITR